MYVCLCRGITDTQIRQAVQAGKDLRQLRKELGLASQCGKCLPMAKAIIKAELDKVPSYYQVA
ncbi:bacterioferritin-associated ferredoxin [Aeromonas molluscorum]|jgi:bacterioferritin-associated ferredoxin|uniref:Bacterioferritin-associated ferredoxin n=1 Tax=Aeromonas molluscorum 848 TaxID=1268236 RepID=R1F8Q1_9GAMM|nr:bacterioferritin-associated ferredoxin [Aeromonas molluscorum]EOD56072.1 bacterioferritin-associated ferredoxin [Aeromonas molluscorum 848]